MANPVIRFDSWMLVFCSSKANMVLKARAASELISAWISWCLSLMIISSIIFIHKFRALIQYKDAILPV